jgi:hypothetical protein
MAADWSSLARDWVFELVLSDAERDVFVYHLGVQRKGIPAADGYSSLALVAESFEAQAQAGRVRYRLPVRQLMLPVRRAKYSGLLHFGDVLRRLGPLYGKYPCRHCGAPEREAVPRPVIGLPALFEEHYSLYTLSGEERSEHLGYPPDMDRQARIFAELDARKAKENVRAPVVYPPVPGTYRGLIDDDLDDMVSAPAAEFFPRKAS